MKVFQVKIIILSVIILVSCLGCASLKETGKGFLGISTKGLENGRKDAIVKTYSLNYANCDTQIREALKIIKAYIYADDKENNLIAIYVSETDTTPVGIFITKVNAGETKVEVSSPSSFAKDLIATKVFGYIEDKDFLKSEGTEEKVEPLISL
ncbi:MAG: hypothetical protein WCY12_02510 [Candidatus Omnitrophota bacterium]